MPGGRLDNHARPPLPLTLLSPLLPSHQGRMFVIVTCFALFHGSYYQRIFIMTLVIPTNLRLEPMTPSWPASSKQALKGALVASSGDYYHKSYNDKRIVWKMDNKKFNQGPAWGDCTWVPGNLTLNNFSRPHPSLSNTKLIAQLSTAAEKAAPFISQR